MVRDFETRSPFGLLLSHIFLQVPHCSWELVSVPLWVEERLVGRILCVKSLSFSYMLITLKVYSIWVWDKTSPTARSYFLFLKSISSLWLQTYSKPFSRSFLASWTYSATRAFLYSFDIAGQKSLAAMFEYEIANTLEWYIKISLKPIKRWVYGRYLP